MKSVILDVQEDENGEQYIVFPEGLLPDDWAPGTVVEWVDNNDGSWLLRKKSMEFVDAVVEFNRVAGTGAYFDARKTALYAALQLEEMAEKIDAIVKNTPDKSLIALRDTLDRFSDSFKTGLYDDAVSKIDRVDALDADIDLAVVALGGACAMGAKVKDAAAEVMRSNLSKFPVDAETGIRYALKDANGKVKKAEGYSPPNLTGMV